MSSLPASRSARFAAQVRTVLTEAQQSTQQLQSLCQLVTGQHQQQQEHGKLNLPENEQWNEIKKQIQQLQQTIQTLPN